MGVYGSSTLMRCVNGHTLNLKVKVQHEEV
ncbi:hypothetical protein Omen_119 [Erwinia phage Omen]|uniref:Uncharacterized protein n=1 Tax=Erwinia phage Harbringer TaxID=3158978 RepID=A0AAU8EKF2_9CAUD